MNFFAESIQVRRDICGDCGEGCVIDHGDASVACYRGLWHSRTVVPGIVVSAPAAVPAPPATPALWAELHLRALRWSGTDDGAWLKRWSSRVPCGECRRHWFATLKANPPTWTDYFGWSVGVHNAVNRRLGKAEVTREQAAEVWNSLS